VQPVKCSPKTEREALNNLENQREDKTRAREKHQQFDPVQYTKNITDKLSLSFSQQKTSLAAIFIRSVSPL